MAWTLRYSDSTLKELKKLDKSVAKEVLEYLEAKISVLEDPTSAGKALSGALSTLWRYRVRDMRVVCLIDKGEVTVLVLRVAHRSVVYGDNLNLEKIAKQQKEPT